MVELSTCNAGEHYSALEGSFEGPEKLLEIWFAPSHKILHDRKDLPNDDHDQANPSRRSSRSARHDNGLRAVPRPVWEDMLSIVKCTVLNVITNRAVDAYLLSESSMFVYPHKLIIKTCGTTTLLLALQRILDVARQYCNLRHVWRVFYSRKAFMFPERQQGPHQSWESEVALLDQFFVDGVAYKIGKAAADHWHLYVTRPTRHISPSTPQPPQPLSEVAMREHQFHSGCPTPSHSDSEDDPSPFGNAGHAHADQTVEIMMTRLNQKALQHFCHDKALTASGVEGGKYVDRLSGIADLYPQAKLDSYLFEPCGYSSNGVWGEHYFTIHVTPEPECSYASFETNIPVEQSHAIQKDVSPIEALVTKVTDIFEPGAFTVTFFTSHHREHHSHSHMIHSMSPLPGFKRTDRILYELDGYDVMYGHYTKET